MRIEINTPYNGASLKVNVPKAGAGRKDWSFGRTNDATDVNLLIEIDRGIRALQEIQKQFNNPRRITAKLARESLGG